MRKLLLVVSITVLCLLFGSEGLTDKDRPQFLTTVPKGETISHYYGALRMAFPTIETLDPTNRPAKPKPFDHKPVPLQIHRVVSDSKDPERILLGSDDRTTTTFWTRLYEAKGDLPERLASCVGMPEAQWILDIDTHVILGDLKVRGFRVRVTLRDYQHRDTTTGQQNVITNVIHVLVEKPMDLSTAGCQQMVDLADEKGVLLQVDFHKRYDPYNIDIMRRVQEGKIGKPYYAYAYMEDRLIVPAEWLSSWAAESTPFWFIGVHKYDLVRWITGKEAVSVVAHGYKGKLTTLGIDTYDAVSASILMEDGLTCTIHANWILPDQFEAFVNQGLRIVGR